MVESIDYNRFVELKETGDYVVLDVLPRDHFEEEHIPGAINVPLETLGEQARNLFTRNQKIIVYCADENCNASVKAAEKLDSLGFENVKDFEGGLKAWESEGNKLEK